MHVKTIRQFFCYISSCVNMIQLGTVLNFPFLNTQCNIFVYLDKFELNALLQIEKGNVFQQDGAPLYYANVVHQFLNVKLAKSYVE